MRDLPFLLPGNTPTLTAVGTINSFLGLEPDERWAIARTSDADLVVDLPYAPTIVLINDEQADPEAVLAAAKETQPFAQVTSRDLVYEQIAGSPLVAGTELTFQAAMAVAALYCAFCVVLALVVSARRRDRFLSYLRTLGLSNGQVRGLVAWEVVPMTLIAIVVGAAVGIALPLALLPAIDLTPFTGGRNQPPIYTDGGTVAALAAGLFAVVVGAVLVVTSINRRRRLGAALRIGEDR
jgi:putative ABC transport system permease protein